RYDRRTPLMETISRLVELDGPAVADAPEAVPGEEAVTEDPPPTHLLSQQNKWPTGVSAPSEAPAEAPADAPHTAPALRAKLRQALAALTELHDHAWRAGPHTILERYLELTGTVMNLLATDTVDGHRAVANI